MSTIYEPKGRAREYSPLALNIYRGCDHACTYCYVKDLPAGCQAPAPTPIASVFEATRRYLDKYTVDRQVLLSFISDPYPRVETDIRLTRSVLALLRDHQVPAAILTKAGRRALDDLPLFVAMGEHVKVGASLTFSEAGPSREWEPGAALPQERLEMLAALHYAGVRTWASFEPVIRPAESLCILERSLPYLREVKLGRWNHDPRAERIDWRSYLMQAVRLCREEGVDLYVKDDLRPFAPAGFLTPDESTADRFALRRPCPSV